MSIPTHRRQGATPDTSIWLVIGDVPDNNDDDHQQLQAFVKNLEKEFEKRVREFVQPDVRSRVKTARGGSAKTEKLRIFVEH